MVMQAMRDGASNKVVKFTLFGLLMMAAIGLAMSDRTGLLRNRGDVSSHDVARVQGETLSLQTFDRNLRGALGRIGIQPKEAYKLGYVDQFASNEVRSMILAEAASDNGVKISRSRIASQIMNMIQPMVGGDKDPKDVLKQILVSQGLSEADLIQSIEREMATSLIAGTIQGGFSVLSDPLLSDLYKVTNEKRTLDYIVFLDKDIKNSPQPTDDDLQKLYESTKETFAIPETRALRLIKLSEDGVRKTINVSQEEILQAYEQTKENYYTPPARLLDEALFDTEDEARKVHESVAKGTTLESAVQNVTGKNIAYLGQKNVEDKQILPEMKDAVLAAKNPGAILGPIKTPVGWYVVVVKKISGGAYKPFNDLRKELQDDIFENKLSDAIYDLGTQVDDLLAAGTSLDDIKKKVDVTVTDLPPVNVFGQDAQGRNALKPYEKISAAVLETGFKLGEGETSPMAEMPDHSFVAVQLVKLQPKTYKPFESVKSELAGKWMQDFARTENKAAVAQSLADIKAGKETLASVAKSSSKPLQSARGLTHASPPPRPIIPEIASIIFTVGKGQPFLLPSEGGLTLAVVSDIDWPTNIDTGSAAFKKFRNDALRNTQNEALMAYIENKNKKYKAAVNNDLLKKAYGSTGP